jgi:hypothetical protein
MSDGWVTIGPYRVYNPAMRRFLALTLLVGSTVSAAKQPVVVRIFVNPEIGANDVATRVRNESGQAITFCVDAGQCSVSGNIVEHTPIPHIVESRRNSEERWAAVDLGWNANEGRRVFVLEAGRSADFPFRIRPVGEIRLVLRYWTGAIPNLNCETPPVGWREIKSRTAATLAMYILG